MNERKVLKMLVQVRYAQNKIQKAREVLQKDKDIDAATKFIITGAEGIERDLKEYEVDVTNTVKTMIVAKKNLIEKGKGMIKRG